MIFWWFVMDFTTVLIWIIIEVVLHFWFIFLSIDVFEVNDMTINLSLQFPWRQCQMNFFSLVRVTIVEWKILTVDRINNRSSFWVISVYQYWVYLFGICFLLFFPFDSSSSFDPNTINFYINSFRIFIFILSFFFLLSTFNRQLTFSTEINSIVAFHQLIQQVDF